MLQIKAGSIDQTIEVFLRDAATGLGRMGLTGADIRVAFARTRSPAVAIKPVALSAPDADHVDGGFLEIDAVNLRGWYRFDLPDAMFATGAAYATATILVDNVADTFAQFQIVDALAVDLAEEVHLCKAALVNRRVHTVSTGVDEIKDDDGTTTLVTMTPTDGGDDTVIVDPS